MSSWTVGEVARRVGLTVRTLHHWEQVGLLVPHDRSPAGYRLYDEHDLQRLQRVLTYRALGLSLEEVRELVDGEAEPRTHLERQRVLLSEQLERLQRVAAAVDRELEAISMGISLTPEERLEVFGDHDPTVHAGEAAQRWGGTDSFRQSQERTAGYGKQEWLAMRAEADDHLQRLVAAYEQGMRVDGPEVGALVVEHREHITRWFYDCSPQMHRELAELYVTDERFAAHYDDRAPGLARWWHDAILAAG